MDYFEIFVQRMILCRKAAEKPGLQFKLIINEQQLIYLQPAGHSQFDRRVPIYTSSGNAYFAL